MSTGARSITRLLEKRLVFAFFELTRQLTISSAVLDAILIVRQARSGRCAVGLGGM